MNFSKYILLLLFSISNSGGLFSQINYDTLEFKKEYKRIDKILEIKVDSAFSFITEALNKTKKSKYSYGYSKSNLQLARYYSLKGKIDSALLFLPVAIKYARISKDTSLIVSSYLFYARSLSTASQYNKAIEQALIAQKFSDHIKDIKLKIKLFHDLGFVHSGIGLHNKSISYYKKGLEIGKLNNDTFNVANISARLGGEFQYINSNDSALIYNLQGLKLFKQLNHKRGIGASMVNLASTYSALKQYDKAIQVSLDAIKIRQELGDDYAVTMLKANLTDCYVYKHDFKKALAMALECEILVKKQNEVELIEQNYNSLSKIYHALNNNDVAYTYSQKLISLKDSIFEKTNLTAINELQTKYETEKKEKEISLLQLENKSNEEKALAEKNTRNLIIASITFIALIITIFTFLLYKRFAISNRQKVIIQKQKDIVDEKNKEVFDSINYALTIQQAVISSEHELINGLTDAMVFFKPKDIVSGDFYWHTSLNHFIFYVVADCTGHGVPGAFMSLMGMNYLSEIINEKKVIDTAEILNLLREKVIASLNKSNSTTQKRDGMDMVIVRLDTHTKQIQFSGANNSIYILNQQGLKEIKGNKMPIGLHSGDVRGFETKTVQLATNDRVFAFTDGLPDQFGGPKGKKLMYKRLETLIAESSDTSLQSFKETLTIVFENWKGTAEQVDDITLICLQI